MLVYNISMKVDPAIEAEWLQWQKEVHIPEVMASGQFTDHKFFRLLEHDDEEGVIYVVQYFAASMENYNHYIKDTAPSLRQKVLERWGDKFIAFRSLMQVVD